MGFWSSVGNAISSAASTVADAAETAVDVVTDTVEDVIGAGVDAVQGLVDDGVDWACQNGGTVGCGVASVLGGIINGSLEAFKELNHDLADITRSSVNVGSEVLRGDFAGALDGLGTLLLDLVDAAVDGLRFVIGGYFVGGIVRQFQRRALRDFVENLLKANFVGEPLARARATVGLDNGDFGFPLYGFHVRFYLDSETAPLWQWHENGDIDLYQLAGLFSADSFALVPNARTVVKTVNDDGTNSAWPINRWQIADYLESKGQDVRLRVYAMSDQALAEKIQTSSEKCEQLGIRLTWNLPERFAWFNSYRTGDWDITQLSEYRFPLFRNAITGDVGFERYLITSNLLAGTPDEDCGVMALGAFRFKARGGKELFGWTGGRDITHSNSCQTQGRTDTCCVLVAHQNSAKQLVAGGVIHRDVWPYDVMRYVLVHEIGHYMGLCHYGHNPSEIMWTIADGQGTNTASWGLFNYYWDDEPRFSLDDAKNVWRFIVDQLQHCLVGPHGNPIDLRAKTMATAAAARSGGRSTHHP